MCFIICHAIFTGVYAMYFCDLVVTSTSMQSSVIVDADFRDLEFHEVLVQLLLLCHMFMLFPSDPCLF